MRPPHKRLRAPTSTNLKTWLFALNYLFLLLLYLLSRLFLIPYTEMQTFL